MSIASSVALILDGFTSGYTRDLFAFLQAGLLLGMCDDVVIVELSDSMVLVVAISLHTKSFLSRVAHLWLFGLLFLPLLPGSTSASSVPDGHPGLVQSSVASSEVDLGASSIDGRPDTAAVGELSDPGLEGSLPFGEVLLLTFGNDGVKLNPLRPRGILGVSSQLVVNMSE